MEKIAVRMMLKPGQADAYRRRHDEIWPELVALLKDAGVGDYSIHLDPETNALFATLWRHDDHGMGALSHEPMMRRWWAWMAPLMETNPDGSPVSVPLQTLFHLP